MATDFCANVIKALVGRSCEAFRSQAAVCPADPFKAITDPFFMKQHNQTKLGGRPTAAEAGKLGDKILETAKRLFLSQGYERTSIEQIAATAHVAKRTLYVRFAGKAEIFDAMVKSQLDRNLSILDGLTFDGRSLRQKLELVAQAVLDHILSADAVAIDRAIVAEAVAFPNLARLYREHAGPRYIEYVTEILLNDRHSYRGSRAQAGIDAGMFLILVMLPPLRLAHFASPEELERERKGESIGRRIDFFMQGIGSARG